MTNTTSAFFDLKLHCRPEWVTGKAPSSNIQAPEKQQASSGQAGRGDLIGV
jgi:hypothetical protein